MFSPVFCCLISVRLVVEEAAADDEPATPFDHDVDLGIEVDEHREGDRRYIGKILNYTKEAKGKPTWPRVCTLAGEQKFSHVLIPQDVVFVEPEFAVFHVGLACVDLQKRAKKQ